MLFGFAYYLSVGSSFSDFLSFTEGARGAGAVVLGEAQHSLPFPPRRLQASQQLHQQKPGALPEEPQSMASFSVQKNHLDEAEPVYLAWIPE